MDPTITNEFAEIPRGNRKASSLVHRLYDVALGNRHATLHATSLWVRTLEAHHQRQRHDPEQDFLRQQFGKSSYHDFKEGEHEGLDQEKTRSASRIFFSRLGNGNLSRFTACIF